RREVTRHRDGDDPAAEPGHPAHVDLGGLHHRVDRVEDRNEALGLDEPHCSRHYPSHHTTAAPVPQTGPYANTSAFRRAAPEPVRNACARNWLSAWAARANSARSGATSSPAASASRTLRFHRSCSGTAIRSSAGVIHRGISPDDSPLTATTATRRSPAAATPAAATVASTSGSAYRLHETMASGNRPSSAAAVTVPVSTGKPSYRVRRACSPAASMRSAQACARS